jgi:two-component system response regulator YesN
MEHREGTIDRRRELYREAVAVIAREYATDIQIEQLARRVASSRRQLQRVFAEVAGTSFRELLAAARMSAARELLAGSALPIKDIAPRVGYPQPAQFSKSFQHHHGMSPKAYRRASRRHAAGAQAAPNPHDDDGRGARTRQAGAPLSRLLAAVAAAAA